MKIPMPDEAKAAIEQSTKSLDRIEKLLVDILAELKHQCPERDAHA